MLRKDISQAHTVLRTDGGSDHEASADTEGNRRNNTLFNRIGHSLASSLFRDSWEREPYMLAAIGFPLQALVSPNINTNLVLSQSLQSFEDIAIGSQYTLSVSISNNSTDTISLGLVESYYQVPGIINDWDFTLSWPNGSKMTPGASVPLNITYTPVIPTNVFALFNLQDNEGRTLPLFISGAGVNTFSAGSVSNATSYITGYNVYSDRSEYVLPAFASPSVKPLGNADPPSTSLVFSPTNVVFGDVSIGNSSIWNVKIKNISESTATVELVSYSQSSLAANICFNTSGLNNKLPITINAGQSTNFLVTFVPPVVGTAVGRLAATDNSGGTATESLYGNGVAGQNVSLQWPLVTDPAAAGVNVYRSMVSGGPYVLLASLVSGTAYVDSTVGAGQTYYYVIEGVDYWGSSPDGYGYSPYSNEASATTPSQ
jgi:hypothetical protein